MQTDRYANLAIAHANLSANELVQYAIRRNEAMLSANQAISAYTGDRTGRSPKDRFIVKDDITRDSVDWGAANQPVAPEIFQKLWAKAEAYIAKKEHFIADLHVGADPHYSLPVNVITELAWHNLFVRNLFIRESSSATALPDWTILNVPSLKTDAKKDGTHSDGTLIINFTERKVLLLGLLYAGEMKKAMFSVMNFLMPSMDVLPMHCAANRGGKGDVALFFGLSGTGKTTLSADPSRYLIGDDEHGWHRDGVFNFEGGCYAKCINLSQANEPLIWDAIRSGTIMENVVLNENKEPDFSDDKFSQNTRAAYPREFIDKRVIENHAGIPNAVIFLCCDLYGVLPPVAKLTEFQAAYYFLSGYTALVGSTEVGHGTEIKPTFSTCFGAPFFPRPPQVYADLLMKRIAESNANVFLVNTGWQGGGYGHGGQRFSIPTTRAIVSAIVEGRLKQAEFENYPGFNLQIPKKIEDVDSSLLYPQKNWRDQNNYKENCLLLIKQFQENFKKFNVAKAIQQAGPKEL